MGTPRKPLFRNEAVVNATTNFHGTILLINPIQQFIWIMFFLIIAVSILLFIIFFDYTKKTQMQGITIPAQGLSRITSPTTGIIREIRVREGQLVERNAVLFIIESEKYSPIGLANGVATANTLEEKFKNYNSERNIINSQFNEHESSTKEKLRTISQEITRLQNQIKLQIERVELANQALKQYEELRVSNFVSVAQLRDKQVDLLDQKQRLSELNRNLGSLERDQSTLKTELQNLRLMQTRDLAAVDRSVLSIKGEIIENNSKRYAAVLASQDGVVTGVTLAPGQTVNTGQLLGSIWPSGSKLEVELYANSRSIGLIQVGAPVTIRYHSFPYQKFGHQTGHVFEISNTAMRSEDMALRGSGIAALSSTESLYRIRVHLDRQSIIKNSKSELFLRSGMTLDANVALESRKLYEWAIEPLLSLREKI